MLELALKLYDLGIVTVPYSTTERKPVIDGGLNWSTQSPTRDAFVAQWQKQVAKSDGIAVMTGEVECLEADVKNDPLGTIHTRLLQLLADNLPEGLFARLFIETSPSGGCHIWYRVRKDEIMGSQVMARIELTDDQCFEMGVDFNNPRARIPLIVETRGYKGLCTMWPSPGYKRVNGSIEDLPILSSDEHELVHMIARSFNEYDPPAVVHNYAPHTPNEEGKRPGDYYNRDTSPEDLVRLLESVGYRKLRQLGSSVFLGRPDAKNSRKHDAKVDMSRNCFVTYSTSIPDFEQLKGYGPFAVYTKLFCRGDFAEATRQVAAKGLSLIHI